MQGIPSVCSPCVEFRARANGSNSSLHHQTASRTGLRTRRLRIRRAVYSLPSAFRKAFELFHNWLRMITAFAGESLLSTDICFSRLIAVKKQAFARSISRSRDAKHLRIRRSVTDARRSPKCTWIGAAESPSSL